MAVLVAISDVAVAVAAVVVAVVKYAVVGFVVAGCVAAVDEETVKVKVWANCKLSKSSTSTAFHLTDKASGLSATPPWQTTSEPLALIAGAHIIGAVSDLHSLEELEASSIVPSQSVLA